MFECKDKKVICDRCGNILTDDDFLEETDTYICPSCERRCKRLDLIYITKLSIID